jgi:hypothetical protein
VPDPDRYPEEGLRALIDALHAQALAEDDIRDEEEAWNAEMAWRREHGHYELDVEVANG